jgi:hypothetical protein
VEIQKKYKLIAIRAKFLKQSLGISSEIFDLATAGFLAAIASRAPTINLQPPNPPPRGAQEQIYHGDPTSSAPTTIVIKEEKDENLKTVFRNIAKQAHPDKLANKSEFEKEYKNLLFEKARLSFETNDYHGILEVAEELGIEPPPPTQQQIESMKKINNKMEKEINAIKNSVVWSWYHGTDDTKVLLLEKYIETIRKNNTRP